MSINSYTTRKDTGGRCGNPGNFEKKSSDRIKPIMELSGECVELRVT